MTTTDRDARAITAEESRGSAALWFGVLGSPLAWLGHLVVNYSLEEWFACSPSAVDRGQILGLGVRATSVLANTAMALVAAGAGATALACGRKLRRATDGERLDRARWMAHAGTVEGAVFLVAILAGYLPPIFLDPCATTP